MPARAAGIGDYAAPFQSVVTAFESIFGQLVALVEPHQTVTVEFSPATMAKWHATGATASAAAFNSDIVASQPKELATSPSIVHVDIASNASVPSALGATSKADHPISTISAGAVLGTSTTDGVVTQSQLQAAIEQASNTLRQLIYANAGTVGQGQYATGGYINNLAISQRIDSLSNVTISNATVHGVSGLTASEIPADIVAANYLPVSGGTVSGNFSVLGSTTLSNLTLGTNCSSFGNGGKLTTDAFGNVHCADDYGSSGGAGSPGGSNTQVQFNDSGSFAGNSTFIFNKTTDILTVTNASTTNLTTSYASTTNLFAGTLALTNALGLASGGTGISSVAAGGVLLGNYAGTGYQQLATSSLGLLTTNVAEGTNLYFTNARAQAAISVTGTPLTYSGGVLGINQATLSQRGYLSSTDFNTFSNKISSSSLSGGAGINYASATGVITNTGVISLAAAYPLQVSGATGALTLSAAYGTTTANTFSALQSFNGGIAANTITASASASFASTTLTGNTLLTNATSTSFAVSDVASSLLKTLSNGAVVAAVAGTDYQAAGTYLTALGSGFATTSATSVTFSTTTQSFNGLTVAQNITAAAAAFTFAPNISGTLNNSGLTNSTISGISLGSNLASLTATDGTLTFSGSYNGSTARTVGLNLGQANTWTALQQFQNASSSLFSVYGPAYFGGTATSSFASNGALSLVSNGLTVGTSQLVVSGGNVGIGTASPGTALDVSRTSADAYIRAQTTTSGNADLELFNNGNQAYDLFADRTNNRLQLKSTSYNFITMDAGTGNVGIGTTSPLSLLSVAGSGFFSGTITGSILDRGGQVFNVKAYGAACNASTDDTASIQAAENAREAAGGRTLFFPTGICKVSGTITVNMGGVIAGSGHGLGGATAMATVLRTTSSTADVFHVTTTDAITFRDLQIDAPGVVKTAGAGILIQPTSSPYGSNLNRQSRIEDVTINQMYDGIALYNAANWSIKDSFIQDFQHDGIYVNVNSTVVDAGDSIITGNTIWDLNVTTGTAGIQLDPAAGIEVVGNKLLSANYGILLSVSQGSTGTLNIAANSVEQQNTSCIGVQQATAGKNYGNITITGNECSILNIASAVSGITLSAGAAPYLSNIAISSNTFNMGLTQGSIIQVNDGNGVTVSNNVLNNLGNNGATGITTGGNATNQCCSYWQ